MVEKKQINVNLSEMYSQSYSYEAKLLNQATGSSLKEQGPYTLQWQRRSTIHHSLYVSYLILYKIFITCKGIISMLLFYMIFRMFALPLLLNEKHLTKLPFKIWFSTRF